MNKNLTDKIKETNCVQRSRDLFNKKINRNKNINQYIHNAIKMK